MKSLIKKDTKVKNPSSIRYFQAKYFSFTHKFKS